MLRVDTHSFPVVAATFSAFIQPDEDEEDVWRVEWDFDISSNVVDVHDEFWNPTLHAEGLLLPIDNPIDLEDAEIKVEPSFPAWDDPGFSLFLSKKEVVSDVRLKFGQRRGDTFDLFLMANTENKHLGDDIELVVLDKIKFTGITVFEETLSDACERLSEFCDPADYTPTPCKGGFRFCLPSA